MERLIAYLRENLILDFQGDLTVALLRELVADDTTPAAQGLLHKVTGDRAVNDMMIVLADCLLEAVHEAVTAAAIREQLEIYAGS